MPGPEDASVVWMIRRKFFSQHIPLKVIKRMDIRSADILSGK
jgi:hypothetical protein